MSLRLSRRSWVLMLGLCLCLRALGQEDPTQGQQGGERTGEVIVVSPEVTVEHAGEQAADSAVGLPTGVVREQVSERIQERLRSFVELREAYLEQQRKLLQELKGAATDRDRAEVRDRIRATRQEWLAEARKIREAARERVQNLRDVLPSHREMLEQAKEDAREEVQQGASAARERVRRGLE